MDDIESILEWGQQIGEVRTLEKGTPFVVVPENSKIHGLGDLLDKPLVNKSNIELNEVDSFIRYFNEHKTSDSRIFVNLSEISARFVAIMDYFKKGDTSWNTHVVSYSCPHTVEWVTWMRNNRTSMAQKIFAEFLEDNLQEIVSPLGADVLEIAKTLTAKTMVNFKSGIRLDNGNQQLIFEETSEATAGAKGDLQIPSELTLGIAPFKATQPYRLTARLKYRLTDGRVNFTYEMVKPHRVIEDACNGLISTIKENTGVQPFAGEYK